MADLQRMGLVDRAAYPIADAISSAELRQALFFSRASQGNPHTEALLRALADEAGGLYQAFAAAFGPEAGRRGASMPELLLSGSSALLSKQAIAE